MSQFNNGPEQVYPSDKITATKTDDRVRLKIPQTGTAFETLAPISIPGLLKRTATKYPNQPALKYKNENKKWQTITYKEYLHLVRTCAKAFLKLGLERHHTVCILGFNSPEWFISDLAAIFAGGIASGIYQTNTPEACKHCLEVSRANIVVVQDEKQLQKILAVKDQLPELKAIVQYQGPVKSTEVIAWPDLMKLGEEQADDALESVMKTICINECSNILFTSGTVGNPKAVMLSHDNLTWNCISACERTGLVDCEEVLISYLPLSHAAAQIVDIYMGMASGACIYFADQNALRGTLIDTLKEVQPTKFLAVPRVWEKMHEKFLQVAAESKGVRKYMLDWALNEAVQHNVNKNNKKIGSNDKGSWSFRLANALVISKIKHSLGLGRSTVNCSAAAPLSADVKNFFLSLDITLSEALGLSECSGAHTVYLEDPPYINNTLGRALTGAKTKIVDPDESGYGELCMYGRHIFMGYLSEPEKTAESIDQDGWLHSGDQGYLDERDFVYLTGRLKELLITAGGENVAPVPIEQCLKAELPCISNACLVGDQRKFLSVLLTLQTEVDVETGRPTDVLAPAVKAWLKELECPAETVSEVLASGIHSNLEKAINEGIKRANAHAISRAQNIQKFVILPRDFSIATGEFGPTLKMRRNIIAKTYGEIIEKIYS